MSNCHLQIIFIKQNPEIFFFFTILPPFDVYKEAIETKSINQSRLLYLLVAKPTYFAFLGQAFPTLLNLVVILKKSEMIKASCLTHSLRAYNAV